jgi:hypothetical protein
MTTEFRHPIFARLVAFVAARAEGSEDDDLRRELLSGLHGRVVELGAGSGPNFRFYSRCDDPYRSGRLSSRFCRHFRCRQCLVVPVRDGPLWRVR